jgi:hypothetical protein
MSETQRIEITKIRLFPYLAVLVPPLLFMILGFCFDFWNFLHGNIGRRPGPTYFEWAGLFALPVLTWRLASLMYKRALDNPSIYIEDGDLIFMSREKFCEPINRISIYTISRGVPFKSLVISTESGKRLSTPLFNFEKNADDIIEAVNAHR